MATKPVVSTIGELRVPSDRDLRRLARFRSPRGVLSLYLSFDPSAGERRDIHAVAIDVLHTMGGTARELITGRLDEEQRRVFDYLREEFALAGRGVAIFSCQPRGLWEVFQLQVQLPPLARFAERPVVAPLAAVLDHYERYAVALVDKDRVRLLHVYLGRVEHEVDVRDKYPGRTEMGGWAQARYQRHRDAHLHAHLLRAAQQLQGEARRHPFDRLLVGGPDEARAAFVALLPRGLRTRVVGTFAAELFLSQPEILQRVAAIEEGVDREAKVRLVADILDAARSGGLATSGWDNTLQALAEGRVHKLVLAKGHSAKGSACPAGHFAALEELPRCPMCQGPLQPVADLTEWAIERALATHAVAETVDSEAATALTEAGEIAAVLRY